MDVSVSFDRPITIDVLHNIIEPDAQYSDPARSSNLVIAGADIWSSACP